MQPHSLSAMFRRAVPTRDFTVNLPGFLRVSRQRRQTVHGEPVCCSARNFTVNLGRFPPFARMDERCSTRADWIDRFPRRCRNDLTVNLPGFLRVSLGVTRQVTAPADSPRRKQGHVRSIVITRRFPLRKGWLDHCLRRGDEGCLHWRNDALSAHTCL